MRDIKFRCWWNDRFTYSCSEEYKREYAFIQFNVGFSHYDPKEFVIQQYTGLNDKNNKEIYEGDILEGLDFTADVFWDRNEPSFQLKTSNGCGAFINEDYIKNFKIIGNIFENKDLLK